MNELTQKNAELGRFLFCERYTLQPVKNSLFIAEGQNLKRGAVVDVNGVLVGTNSLMPYAVLETDCDTRAKGAFASVFVKGEFNFDKLFFADGLSKEDLDNIVYNGSGTGLVIKPYNFSSGFVPKSEIMAANLAAEVGNLETLLATLPSGGLVNIGGRTYRTITIGGVTWLAQNLDFKFSGCEIGADGTPAKPAAWYYNNNEATYGLDGTYKCGLLYNWYAVKYLNDNRATLIPGWHVASNSEWDNLATAVGGISTAGTKLKATDYTITSDWPSGWGGTNDYGFNVIPTGYEHSFSFNDFGSYAYIWTSTEYSYSNSYFCRFGTGEAMYSSNSDNTYGFSVRLVKDT